MNYSLLTLTLLGLTPFLNGQSINVTSTGVGLGTTTPNARLDLGAGYGTNGEKLLIYNDSPSSALAGTKLGFYLDRFGNNNAAFVFPTSAAYPGSYVVASKDTSDTVLIPRMTVQGQTGNVGIGTLTPSTPLEVKGAGIFSIQVNPDQPLGIGSNHDGYEMNVSGGIPDGANMGGQIRLGGSTRGDGDINVVQFKQNGVDVTDFFLVVKFAKFSP